MLGRDTQPITIADVYAAQKKIRAVVPPTPLFSIETLNQQVGGPVYLKAESLLPSGAYKFRGATNKISSLIELYGKDIQIVTASSGNHGLACALAGRTLGIKASVVVPEPTPMIKQNAIRALGANLVVYGENYDASFAKACEMSEKEHMYYVHPVADRFTASGQGTIAMELLEQLPDVDQVIVPVGGGGLITGISFVLKTLKPSVKVIGVMPEGSDVYVQSRKAGKLVELEKCASLADAVVRKTGEDYLFPYVEKNVDELVTVSEETLKKAVKMACLYGKLTLEGAGALPLAALLEGKCRLTEKTVLICSGGNIDQGLLEACLKV